MDDGALAGPPGREQAGDIRLGPGLFLGPSAA